MGFLGIFNKEKNTAKKMSDHVDNFNIVLKKKKVEPLTARVVFVIDTSGSMSSDFTNGIVQDITERVMPLAIEFDDNGEMEIYIFSNDCKQISSVSLKTIDGFIKKGVMSKIDWGGTNYAPAINMITRDYGINNPSEDPTFVIFMTDGDNFDKIEARKAITNAANYNIFWKFVGIGSSRMSFLEELDNMEGRVVDNANFFQVRNINKMSDEDLYSNLLEEYSDWISKVRQLKILKK